MENKVRAIMIVEIAGRPANHIRDALDKHVSQLKNIKDVEVVSLSINQPKKLEAEQEMYTCFAEIEVKTIDFSRLVDLIFDFMPSSVDIIEPSEVEFDMVGANSFLNRLAGRLHRYDEIAKISQMQVQNLAHQLDVIRQRQPSQKSSVIAVKPGQPLPSQEVKKKIKKKKRK